jgi:hypothetical protein
MVVHTCNPSTQEAEDLKLEAQTKQNKIPQKLKTKARAGNVVHW